MIDPKWPNLPNPGSWPVRRGHAEAFQWSQDKRGSQLCPAIASWAGPHHHTTRKESFQPFAASPSLQISCDLEAISSWSPDAFTVSFRASRSARQRARLLSYPSLESRLRASPTFPVSAEPPANCRDRFGGSSRSPTEIVSFTARGACGRPN